MLSYPKEKLIKSKKLREARNSKIIYCKKSHIQTISMHKSVYRDIFIHLKPISDYHVLPTQRNYDFLKFFRYHTSVKLPKHESAIAPIHHYKTLENFGTYELPITNSNIKALIRVIRVCNQRIKSMSLCLTNFHSLSSSECISFHIKILNHLKRLAHVTHLELILAVVDDKILKCIAEGLSVFKELKELVLDFPHIPIDSKDWICIQNVLKQRVELKTLWLKMTLSNEPLATEPRYFDFLLELKALIQLTLKVTQKNTVNFLCFSNDQSLELNLLQKFSLKVWTSEVNQDNFQHMFTGLKFPNLTHLELDANKINDINGRSFSKLRDFTQGCNYLIALSISIKMSYLVPESFNLLAESLQPKLKSLQFIIKNQVNVQENFCRLIKKFSCLSELEYMSLDFSSCNFNCFFLKDLALVLSVLENLENFQLNISGNVVQDPGILSLSKSLGLLSNLKHINLNLAENKFTSVGLHDLLEAIQHLKKLCDLYLNIKDCRYLTPYIKSKALEQLRNSFPKLKQDKTLVLIK